LEVSGISTVAPCTGLWVMSSTTVPFMIPVFELCEKLYWTVKVIIIKSNTVFINFRKRNL